VNGVSLVSATHYQAVAAIKSAGTDMTMVVVKATTSQPANEQVSVLCMCAFFNFSPLLTNVGYIKMF